MRCLRSGIPVVIAAGLLTVLAVGRASAQPAISQLDAFFPSTTSPGGAAITAGTTLPNGFTLQISGTGFTTPFTVNWIDNNNPANNTSFSSTQENTFLDGAGNIQVPTIPAALVATATSITVQVVIGSSTVSAPFTVNAPLPALIPVGGTAVVLPNGVVGGNYAQPLFATGDGTAPFTISLQSGTLPPGLPVFSPQGTVSSYDNYYVGSPTTAGPYTFRLGITDTWGNSTALPYSLTINPAPVVSSFNPPIIPAGSLGYTLTVNGANFVAGSVVSWRSSLTGNTNLATTYVSPTQLTAVVPANLIQSYDLPVVRVTVPGGGFVDTSYTVTYPIISSVSPSYVTAGHPAFTITVTGQYFLTVPSVTKIVFGGVALATTSPSPGVLQATVPAASVANAGTPTFWVQNPGGQVSFAYGDYTVLPPDVVSSLSPANRTAGAGSFVLTVSGTNLVNVASVQWDQSSLTTFTVTGSTQITVTIPATLLTPGVHNVGVLTTDGAPSNTRPFTVSPALSINNVTPPTGTEGQGYSLALTASGGVSPYTWSATGLPTGLSLNSSTGAISGTANAAGTFAVSVTLRDSGGGSASAQFTVTIKPGIPQLQLITTSPLPSGISGTAYTTQFGATGGTPGYFWAITAGSLPNGLLLTTNGILSGTPTKTGDFRFTVQVTDSSGATASAAFVLTITAPPLTITTSAFSDTPVGTSFNTQFTATGGVPPYVWAASGSIPSGTTFSGSGVLSGKANTAGGFQFNIQVTDSAGTVMTKAYTINITKQSLTLSGSPGNGQVGAPYSATFTASGGQPPYSFSASGLPGGLSFSGSAIGGTPAAGSEGTYTVTVTVTDAAGAKTSVTGTVVITAAGLQITTDSLPNGTIGGAYSASVAASGGVPPYTFSASGLPPGVSISAGGAISGTIPSTTAPGVFAVTATVTDSKGGTASRSYNVTVGLAALTITGISNSTAVAGTPFSATAAASGGKPPYTWSGSGPGVTVSADGVLTATFTTTGTVSVSLSVKDSAGATASQTVQINVSLPTAPTSTLSGLPATASPASQSTLQVTLTSPYPVGVVVTLTMTFAPDSGPDDPSVQFSTGGRTVQVTVPAGSTSGTSSVGVQTGTVAGTITITTRLQAGGKDITPTPAPQQTLRINAGAPVIRSVTATRTSGGFTVTVVGFATDRELTQAVFQLTGASSANLQTTSVTVAVDQVFASWFGSAASAQYGSQFTYTQPFTVQGDSSAVVSVSVTLANKVGTSTAVSATLQ
jgi:large repetitive protein